MSIFKKFEPLFILVLNAIIFPFGIYSAAVFMGTPADRVLIITAVFIVFPIYAINKYTDKEDIHNKSRTFYFFIRHPGILHVSILMLLTSIVILIFFGKLTWFHVFIILAGITYSVKIIPWYSKGRPTFLRLKDVCFAKSLSVAITWGSSFFALNWLVYPTLVHNKFQILLLIVNFNIAAFINTVFCDIMDIKGDMAEGIPTIPARLGVRNTYIRAMLLPAVIFLCATIPLAVLNKIPFPLELFFLFNLMYPAFYISMYYWQKMKRSLLAPMIDSCGIFFSVGLLTLHLIGL